MIQKTDKYRADYYEYYTRGEDWTNPVLYDMTLNSARIGRDRCVDLIIDYLNIKFDVEKYKQNTTKGSLLSKDSNGPFYI